MTHRIYALIKDERRRPRRGAPAADQETRKYYTFSLARRASGRPWEGLPQNTLYFRKISREFAIFSKSGLSLTGKYSLSGEVKVHQLPYNDLILRIARSKPSGAVAFIANVIGVPTGYGSGNQINLIKLPDPPCLGEALRRVTSKCHIFPGKSAGKPDYSRNKVYPFLKNARIPPA